MVDKTIKNIKVGKVTKGYSGSLTKHSIVDLEIMKIFLSVLFSIVGLLETFAQDIDKGAYLNYINAELYGEFVDGYFINKNLEKIEVKLKYEQPALFQNSRHPVYFLDEEGEEKKRNKSDLLAFFLNDHLIVPEVVGGKTMWLMLSVEGPIQQTILFQPQSNKYPPDFYSVNRIVSQSEFKESIYVGHLAVNFNRTMSRLTRDNQALTALISEKQKGYMFVNYKKIIAEYNLWFNATYPEKMQYLLPVPDYQKFIDNDTGKLIEHQRP